MGHVSWKAPGLIERDKGTNPRALALSVLGEIRTRGGYANLLLPKRLDRVSDPQSASFVTDAVYGSLRWQGLLDAVVSAASRRDVRDIQPQVLDILRLGTYQLLFMEVPAYAAVSSSVALARSRRSTARAAGFVNAVLRRVSARDRRTWESLVVSRIPKSEPICRLSVRWSHPQWISELLARSWEATTGLVRDGSRVPDATVQALSSILEADNKPACVTLVARPGLISVEELSAQIRRLFPKASVEPGRWSPFALRVRGVSPGRLPAVRDGRAGIEDEGSQLAALCLASAPLSAPLDARSENGGRWLDLCAGPGGKAALLACLAAQRGARLRANEVNAARAHLVEENLQAVPAAVEAVTVADGQDYARSQGTESAFSRVLVDAPCSGLGALRRRPEARWTKSPDQIATLVSLQTKLLESAIGCAAPGGVIAYVTCSPVVAETREVVSSVCSSHPEVRRLDAAGVLERILGPKAREFGLPARGDVQMFTDRTGTDMMFVSLLRKDRES